MTWYVKSAEQSYRLGLPRDEIRARLKIGLISWNTGKVSDAAGQYAAAKSIAERIADRKFSEAAG